MTTHMLSNLFSLYKKNISEKLELVDVQVCITNAKLDLDKLFVKTGAEDSDTLQYIENFTNCKTIYYE